MESSLSNSVFAMVGEDIAPAAFVRSYAHKLGLTERWLQDAIAANPELVLGPCRAAGLIDAEPWYLWQKEFEIQETGSIDVLLVSASGRIGIVETKMAYNAEKRRAVLAQVLEYSLGLKALDADDLPALSGRRCSRTSRNRGHRAAFGRRRLPADDRRRRDRPACGTSQSWAPG
jgi:hypothetical protein